LDTIYFLGFYLLVLMALHDEINPDDVTNAGFLFQAGLVTTLNTRTTVFGVTNPKGQYDPYQRILSIECFFVCVLYKIVYSQ
jgi:hypothetical protein